MNKQMHTQCLQQNLYNLIWEHLRSYYKRKFPLNMKWLTRAAMKSRGFNASKRTEDQVSIDASIADITRPNVICFLTAVNQGVEHGTHL